MITEIAARLEAVALDRPDAPAIEDGTTTLSYRALVERAGILADRLQAAGLLPGHHVAMVCASDAARIVTAFGILRAGGVYAPIDPELPPNQIEALRAHADCALVVHGAEHGALRLSPCRADAARSDGAYLRFTSGSTGTPKAILHSHLTAVRLGEAFAAGVDLKPSDRVTLFNPFWHTLVWGTLLTGATLCLFDMRRYTPAALARALATCGVTVYSSFPTAFRQLVAAIPSGSRIATIRRLSLSGEALTREDVEAARRCFAADCVVVNSYGASELGHISSQAIAPDAALTGPGIAVGYPFDGVELRLVDDQARRIAESEAGEVAVRCAHLTPGYWRRPDLTARSYVADPEHPAGVIYLTGDIGRIDADGALHVVGRKDRQIKIRGHRVLPEEVEAVLATHPGVREVAVAAKSHGSGHMRLVAIVVARDEPPFSPTALRAHVAARLPDYMVPTEITRVQALPRAASGKLDWRALTPATPPTPPPSPTPVSATQPLELQVLAIWEESLSARPIGLDDDFFDIGGDSLSAAQVTLRIEVLLDREVPMRTIYDAPTIRSLAARLLRQTPPDPTVMTFNEDGGRRPLFFFHPERHASTFARTLATVLPPNQPLSVVAPPGCSPADPLPATVEEIGAARAQLIRRLQPKGAVALAGICNGALMAYATAAQLLRDGVPVDALILIDPPSFMVLPAWVRRMIDMTDRLLAAAVMRQGTGRRTWGWVLNEVQGRKIRERHWRVHEAANRALTGAAAALGMIRRPPADSDAHPPWRDLYDRLNRVTLGYLPQPVPVRLDLVLTTSRTHWIRRPQRWRHLATDVTIHRIPATHLGCLTRESAALAEPLRDGLERHAP